MVRSARSHRTAQFGAHAMIGPLFRAGLFLTGFSVAVMASHAQAAEDDESPSEAEVERAIERGLDFLKRSQGDDGSWQFHFMHEHRLGMTALAGLALLE